jgi:4'-phosphopantetheinyl transferase
MDVLSNDERSRAARFHAQDDRHRFALSRYMIRTILASHLCCDPCNLVFSYGPQGKPSLDRRHNCTLHFNSTHSGDVILCAFHDRPVGVDVEKVRPDLHWREIAERFYSPGERRALDGAHEEDQRRLFFQYWVRKEACLKVALDHCDVTGVSVTPSAGTVGLSETFSWYLQDLDLGDKYAAAVASPESGFHVSCWDWDHSSVSARAALGGHSRAASQCHLERGQ